MIGKQGALGVLKFVVGIAALALLPLGGACAMEADDPDLEEVAAGGDEVEAEATPQLVLTGLQGAQGSTVGPDGKLYVTEGVAGRVLRVDPANGSTSVFASGLPQQLAGVGIGGPVDIAFLGNTAYVLVTLVGSDLGGSSTVGVYRINSATSSTVIADVGAFAIANPPSTVFAIPSGVQFAIEPYLGALLITDGHHNRLLKVTPGGSISVVKAFGNIVPTGLETLAAVIYMAQAGPIPHTPANGKIVQFLPVGPVLPVASGARLNVDVEFGPGGTYALSQGVFPAGAPDGAPATPNTGALFRATLLGGMTQIQGGLNQPTSLEFIGGDAYIVNLPGEIVRIDL